MKKTFSIVLCFVLFFSLAFPTYASSQNEVIYSQEYTLEDGTTVKDEIIVHGLARSTYKTATRRRTFSDDGTTIAIIAFQATFRYDGSTVAVISKSITQTDTYEGWSYKQTSFTSSGGTVTLEAKLTKLLVFNNKFTMTLTCDKDGNISST